MTFAQTVSTKRKLSSRNRADTAFKMLGRGALLLAFCSLLALAIAIFSRTLPALTHHQITLDVAFEPDAFDYQTSAPSGTDASYRLIYANYGQIVGRSLEKAFPEIVDPAEKRALRRLVSPTARMQLRDRVLANPSWIGTKQRVALYVSKGAENILDANEETVDPQLTLWLTQLQDRRALSTTFKSTLFTRGDSREPESAGLLAALVGSLLTIAVSVAISFPVGLLSAVYLEQFATRSRLTDIIEVNINNLAAVPSILFGLLGLAVFINVFHMPRSSPLVGGLTLSLMMLPTIIIASRAALSAVPNALKAGALAVGASPVQAIFHHVVPQAMPGIITGTLLAIAQALGETAPLLLLGMVAFIVDLPSEFTDAATALPVQIYMWAESPETAFSNNAAAAVVVLLCLLLALNSLAMILRSRFQKRI